jgi:hypothetical protein
LVHVRVVEGVAAAVFWKSATHVTDACGMVVPAATETKLTKLLVQTGLVGIAEALFQACALPMATNRSPAAFVPTWERGPIVVACAPVALNVGVPDCVSCGDADTIPEYSISPAVPADAPDCVTVTPALDAGGSHLAATFR